ncbi:amino acid adenylation domain-containing protein [Streptomyces sp. B1I3]|uniref:non-ribosomal peptide synthetase n=1 Tax=Streptomyces sp. B1I3 TaxID=3042264 RepID=UPI0027D79BD3|nr:non-ribosomal peptide synthetase [Streptomyces sp. B1I3]
MATDHPAPRDHPTSPAQRRLWFVDRLAPGGCAYTVPLAVRIRGALDQEMLRAALDEIVVRHEVLRTTFHLVDGEPVQRVHPARRPLPLAVHDLTGEPGTERLVDEAIDRASRQVFDLATRPPFTAELLRLGPTEHVLSLAAHHIVVDGWSLGRLLFELEALYTDFVVGRPASLPPLPLQYGDFARRLRSRAGEGSGERERAYWRTALEGAPPVLELPAVHPRTAAATGSGAGALRSARLSAGLTEDLVELAELHGSTLFMTLLTAFDVLLHRYTGRTDLVVGTPVAGRLSADVEPMIGCFINTLPLRVRVDPQRTFEELLGDVREVALGAYDHQALSFEEMVQMVHPDRSAGLAPLFQVMFAVNNTPPPAAPRGPLRFEPLPARRSEVKYDLNMSAAYTPAGIDLAVEYRTDLFDEAWVDRFLAQLRTLLQAVVEDPAGPVGDLPLLPAAERRLLLHEWNATGTDYPPVGAVHELIHRQVDLTPEAVALSFEGSELTYRELDGRANRLARHLRALGVGRGGRVGLCLHRSTELVVALLAVLKAGAAYVPLDPGHPEERRAFLCEDAGTEVVLTHAAARDRVPSAARLVVDLDADDAALEAYPEGRPEPVNEPDDSAYVIYTSGSTGTPKGVANSHRGIVNRLLWMQECFDLHSDDSVLQKTPYSFDVSVWEFLWPLMTGARLVVARPDGHKDPGYLAGLISAERVTTLHFVPSMLEVFLEAEVVGDLTSLRRVVCSGEALPAALARRFLAETENCGLHNLYGPTEAAVDVSHWQCRPGEPGPTVPIGRPIANTRLYVLDERGAPAPVGVPGELCIAGVQVAEGYLNRPELTASRFVTDPFHRGRMYRTGDLARWRPDGALDFLGRLDDQVKLRGFRIELGEVEAAARAVDGVRNAVAAARDQRLVAYVAGDRELVDTARLRAAMGRTLPEYMVPETVVWLDEVPLSPNGKVDRKALPDPGVLTDESEQVTARDGLELALVALWEDVLGRRPIGVTDDFFDLGGTSLRAVRLLSRVTAEHGRELPLSSLFAGGATIERMAAELRDGRSGAWSPIVPIRAAGSRPPLFCLPPAVGNALSYLDLTRHLPDDQPVYGLQSYGLDTGQHPVDTLEEAVEHYLDAIVGVQPEGPYHLVGFCVGSVVAYAVAQRLHGTGREVGSLTMLDGGPPNLDNGLEQADEADLAAWFGWELGRAADRRLEIDPAALRGLPPERLTEELLARAAAADVLPPDTATGQLSRLMAVFNANVRAVRGYPLEPWDGPLTVVRAAEEPQSPVGGWQRLVGRPLEIHDVPGDHYTMMRPPHVPELADLLARATDPDTPGSDQ